MVIVQILGGLGNQMFQYAAAKGLATALNTDLKLDVSGYRVDTLRSYGLEHFRIAAEIASEEEIFWLKAVHRLQEKHFHFDPEIWTLSADIDDVYLEGYWQSPKYFQGIEVLIRHEFQVRTPPDGRIRDTIERMTGVEGICVHVRRGDYVSNPTVNYLHGVCPLDYYARAVAEITAATVEPHFFVFSDDWRWAMENLAFIAPVTFITLNGPEYDYEDLRLMTFCKHHIIANSSFSWWGAWLADCPQKIVYAPRQWFNRYAHDTRDLIPEGWRQI